MTPFELREAILQADWSKQEFKDLAGLLCDLWIAAEENQRQVNLLPWFFDESGDWSGVHLTCVRKDFWKQWQDGAFNDVSLVLSKLRAIR
jgi:hypothetical protein